MLEYDYGDHYTNGQGPDKGTTFNREDRIYWVPMFVPGSAEYTNMNTALMDKHPELAMFFERMTFLPLEKITPIARWGNSIRYGKALSAALVVEKTIAAIV